MNKWLYIPALAAAVPLALAVSQAARSQSMDGYLNDDIALRAGPAPEYPEIEGLPYGTYVSVQGCTSGWEWCNVVADQGDWGWVPGDYIDYVYEGQPVVVTDYGPRIGIPIVSFSIATYWDAHYRDRPFYRERTTWFHRDIPHHAPPPHHASHRGPPPPPPGGWHHATISAHTSHNVSGAPSHHENTASPPHHATTQSQHHENAQYSSHHENAPSSSHHENAPNPPRSPMNEPERPRGDHHANIPTPPAGAPHPVPPHAANVPRPSHPAPPENSRAQRPHPASSSGHGNHPPHPKKKNDHDNNGDNGH